ncbi:MAG: hypothetical protein ACR2HD_03435 [Solirubrobacteraceae bacterium]
MTNPPDARCPSAEILFSAPRSLKDPRVLKTLGLQRHRPADSLHELLTDERRRADGDVGDRAPCGLWIDRVSEVV